MNNDNVKPEEAEAANQMTEAAGSTLPETVAPAAETVDQASPLPDAAPAVEGNIEPLPDAADKTEEAAAPADTAAA